MPILVAVNFLIKGTIAVMYEVAFLRIKVFTLRKANKGLNKRWRVKKTRV